MSRRPEADLPRYFLISLTRGLVAVAATIAVPVLVDDLGQVAADRGRRAAAVDRSATAGARRRRGRAGARRRGRGCRRRTHPTWGSWGRSRASACSPPGSTCACEAAGATAPASDATASARAMRRNDIRRTSGSDRPCSGRCCHRTSPWPRRTGYARLAVTERVKVHRFVSGTSWLRIERPLRLIVSTTLPWQPWAVETADEKRDLAADRALEAALDGLPRDADAQLRDEARDDDVAHGLGGRAELVGDDDAQRLAADVSASRRELARERSGGEHAQRARSEHDGGGLQPGRSARGEHDAGLARDRARPGHERDRRARRRGRWRPGRPSSEPGSGSR